MGYYVSPIASEDCTGRDASGSGPGCRGGSRFEENCFWDLELVELFLDTLEDAHEGEEMFSGVEFEVGSIDVEECALPLEVVAVLAEGHKGLDVPSLHCTLCLLPLTCVYLAQFFTLEVAFVGHEQLHVEVDVHRSSPMISRHESASSSLMWPMSPRTSLRVSAEAVAEGPRFFKSWLFLRGMTGALSTTGCSVAK